MHSDRIEEAQLSEVRRLLALRPTQAQPNPPQAEQAAPAPSRSPSNERLAFRIREPWEPPGADQPNGSGSVDDDDDDDEYDDDEYDDDEYEDDEYEDDLFGEDGDFRRPDRETPRSYPARGTYHARRVPQTARKRRGRGRYILVILALTGISFGAVKLLGSRSNQELTTPSAESSAANPPAQSTQPGSTHSTAGGTTSLANFAGYPGQQSRDGGEFAVNSVAAANGQQLAAGSADGHPAIWRQGPGNAWTLAGGAANGVLAGRPGVQTLTAITAGPAGWLAVGGVVSGSTQHPVVVTSGDGETWRAADSSAPFGEEGLYTYGATAGRFDYVIVGEHVSGTTTTAATWWSDGLSSWRQGGNGHLDGTHMPSEMFGVTVGREQFIAVGAHGSHPAVWTSPNGQQWTLEDLPLPAGTAKAALRQVIAHGSLVVATGNAETSTGTMPFTEVSADDGATWHEVTPPVSGSRVVVTALTASGAGFTMTGQTGQGAKASAMVWKSADGRNWTAAAIPGPAVNGGGTVTVITGLTSRGTSVSGIGIAATKAGNSPVVYTAPAG